MKIGIYSFEFLEADKKLVIKIKTPDDGIIICRGTKTGSEVLSSKYSDFESNILALLYLEYQGIIYLNLEEFRQKMDVWPALTIFEHTLELENVHERILLTLSDIEDMFDKRVIKLLTLFKT